tara:strand:+ start:886 stop:3660 length:2775 start_codon:yes stop_codon:yes gene_type:complete
MAYTEDQVRKAISKAEAAGNTEAVNRFKSLLTQEDKPVETKVKTLDQVREAVIKAEAAGDTEAVNRLSKLAASTEDPSDPGGISYTDAYLNAAKVGATQAAGLIAGVTDALKPYMPHGMVKNVYDVLTSPDDLATAVKAKIAEDGIIGRFSKSQKRVEDVVQDLTGADPTMPKPKNSGIGTQFTLSGVRELTDWTNYLGGVGFKLFPILGRAVQSGSFGVTSEVGAEAIGQIEKEVIGTDSGIGRLIGGLKGGAATALTTPAIKRGASGLNSYRKQLWAKYKDVKENPQRTANEFATGSAKRLLEKAAEGMKEGEIDQVVKDFERIAKIVGKENFPLLVSLSNNPTLKSQAVRLARTDDGFRKRIQDELSEMALVIDNRAKELFGPQYAVANVEMSPEIIKRQSKRQENIEVITDELEKFSTRLIPTGTKSDVGLSIKNLVEARKRIAKDELSVNYKELMKQAQKAGAKLPKEDARSLHNFIVENNFRDIFGRGTPLDKRIMKVFGPKEDGSFSSVNFHHVDSLKRAINLQKRRPNLPDDIAYKLNLLDEEFKRVRKNIPGDWSSRLNSLDRLFYEKVGMPFGEQGIKDISSKKYGEQVAPVLLDKKESLDSFLDVAGEEGVVIAKNAMYSKIYQDAFDDFGLIDRKKLLAFQRKNREIINSIPGMKDEVTAILADESILQLKRKSLDDAYQAEQLRVAKNILLKDGIGGIDFNKQVRGMIGDTSNIDKFFKNLDDLSPEGKQAVLNASRAEFISIARREGTSMYSFITDPKNTSVVKNLFGDTYINDVKDIAKLQDAILEADVSKLSAVVTKQELDILRKVAPGLDVPYVSSQLRDRISSFPQKLIRIASRFQVAAGQGAVDKAIAELLLDPDGLKKLRNAKDGFDIKLNTPEAFKNIKGAYTDILPLYFYVSAKTAVQEQEQ